MFLKTPKSKYKHHFFNLHEKGTKKLYLPQKLPAATIYYVRNKTIVLKPIHLEIIRRIVSKRLKQRRSNFRHRLHPICYYQENLRTSYG